MATVISRFLEDEARAKKLERTLANARFPRGDVKVLTKEDKETAKALTARMTKLGIEEDTAKAYAKKLSDGGAVLCIRAGYKPLTAKTIALDILDKAGIEEMGGVDEAVWVRDTPSKSQSILADHPLFFTRVPDPSNRKGPVSTAVGLRLISRRKPGKRSVMSSGRRMSRFFWPGPLLSSRRMTRSTLSKQGPISNRFDWAPLLSKKKRDLSVIRGGGLVLSGSLGIPTIIRR